MSETTRSPDPDAAHDGVDSEHREEAAVDRGTRARGLEVLRDPVLNKGTAFTAGERRALGLEGLLPATVESLDQRARRAYGQYRDQPSDLAGNIFLEAVRDRDEVLYYRLLGDHLQEMLPVVYDPTVARAIETYSTQYRRPRGVYLSVDDPDGVERALSNLGLGAGDVDLLVASDAEQILGIGDWGAGGAAGITAGKLAVYTAAAGIDPARTIPVALDVGTDNEELLAGPAYVGNRHARVRGERYDAFIDAYVTAATRLFPEAVLHWEDFGPANARRILDRYRDAVPAFNDDVQGTGAIVLAAMLGAARVCGTPVRDQRIVVFGAGTAGLGIADQLREAMVRDGLTEEEATGRVWPVDRQGLLTDAMDGLRDFQAPYARPASEVRDWAREDGAIGLHEVVERVRPTLLLGTSTVHGAFTEEVVTTMARHTERPAVFPISNPTERMEASAEDLLRWTRGRALVAVGVPAEPVSVHGVRYSVAQANNALVFPGIGLGAVVCRARAITDALIRSAAEAVAAMVDTSAPGASLLPEVADLREVSARVAVAVVRQAQRDGLARVRVTDPDQQVRDAMWQPLYRPLGAW